MTNAIDYTATFENAQSRIAVLTKALENSRNSDDENLLNINKAQHQDRKLNQLIPIAKSSSRGLASL
jgi:multidrug resistance efflux pump